MPHLCYFAPLLCAAPFLLRSVWDIRTGKETKSIAVDAAITSMELSVDGKTMSLTHGQSVRPASIIAPAANRVVHDTRLHAHTHAPSTHTHTRARTHTTGRLSLRIPIHLCVCACGVCVCVCLCLCFPCRLRATTGRGLLTLSGFPFSFRFRSGTQKK